MTARLYSLPRGGSGAPAPLVPANVDLQEDAIFLRLPPSIFDSEWAVECTRDERLAGLTLRARALKQANHAGSLPASDRLLGRLADYGDDIAGWEAVKAKALEGWILCSDGRWHHPDIARNVLHIWIGRLESRRVSTWGNKGRAREGSAVALDSIMSDMDEALAALARIDPQDAVVNRGIDQQIKWRRRIADAAATDGGEPPVGTEEPIRPPNRSPNRPPPEGGPKVRQAKRSQLDSSSPRSGDDSSDPVLPLDLERDEEGGSANRTAEGDRPRSRASPWPPDASAALRERYPRRDAWGRAEKALERIRRAGKIPIEEILAGADRVAARVASGELALKFTPLAATWLADRGWEDPDPPDTPPRGVPPPGSWAGRARSGPDSAVAGIDAVFARRTGPPGAWP